MTKSEVIRMEGRKIWYLCDGEKPECRKNHCYKNTDDDPCRHTTDIRHAMNFKKKVHGGHVSYWEKRYGGDNATKESGTADSSPEKQVAREGE